MTKTKPIPIRLTDGMLARLDSAAKQTGLGNRTAVMKLCLVLFLDALEKQDYQLPGVNMDDLIRHHDGRTYRYSKLKKKGCKPGRSKRVPV
jgi:hypothetical protein